MRNLLSIFRKRRPIEFPIEYLAGVSTRLEGLERAVDHLLEDGRTFNTAINRIERKQNRWLDVLNLKDKGGDGEAEGIKTDVVAPTIENRGQAPQAGEALDM